MSLPLFFRWERVRSGFSQLCAGPAFATVQSDSKGFYGVVSGLGLLLPQDVPGPFATEDAAREATQKAVAARYRELAVAAEAALR